MVILIALQLERHCKMRHFGKMQNFGEIFLKTTDLSKKMVIEISCDDVLTISRRGH